jgi:prepilin peptidase CpaA
MSLPVWSTGASVLLVCVAGYIDLRWRRIPNFVTFPAIAIGLFSHAVGRGWGGLLLSLSGMLLAPCVLSLLHLGRGPGMGDIKLAAALGAILGPPLGTLTMLASAIAGGFLAAFWYLAASSRVDPVRFLFRRSPRREIDRDTREAGSLTRSMSIPYGLALSIGTIITLAAYWCTGPEQWFF